MLCSISLLPEIAGYVLFVEKLKGLHFYYPTNAGVAKIGSEILMSRCVLFCETLSHLGFLLKN